MSKTTPHSTFLEAVERSREIADTRRAEAAARALSATMLRGKIAACGHRFCVGHKSCQLGSGMVVGPRPVRRAGAVVSPPTSTPQGPAGDTLRGLRKKHRDLLIEINDDEREFERDPAAFSDRDHELLAEMRTEASKLERHISTVTRATAAMHGLTDTIQAARDVA